MKESIGYTLTLNIAIVFIVIIFVFLSNIIIYYKAYKVSNVITSSIEKYEGFNDLAINEIKEKLSSIGYSSRQISCGDKSSIIVDFGDYKCFNFEFYELNSGKYNINQMNEYKDMLRMFIATEMKLPYDASLFREKIDGGLANGSSGYCVYKCIYSTESDGKNKSLNENEYFYRIKTNMYAEIPLLNNFINYSIYTDTNIMYDFEGILD